MNIGWCVCDMDGTLLDSKNNISPENKNAFAELVRAGIQPIIATGRLDVMIRRYQTELNIKTPVIACNGALIRNHDAGEIVFYKEIERALVFDLMRYFDSMGYYYMAYTIDSVYYSEGNPRTSIFEEYNRSVSPLYKVPLIEAEEIRKHPGPILKVLVSQAKEGVQEEIAARFNKDGRLTVVSSGKGLVDIMSSNISKGEALKHLSRKIGMDLSKTVVFGDNYNDISMFEACGLPIAMGNAEDEVKKAARLVTVSNDESGVAYAIRKYILTP